MQSWTDLKSMCGTEINVTVLESRPYTILGLGKLVSRRWKYCECCVIL